MHLTFEYMPADLRELAKVARRNKPSAKKTRQKQNYFGWIFFVILALLLFYLVNSHQTKRVAMVTTAYHDDTGQSFLAGILPWAIVACIVLFFVVRILYPSDATLKRKLGDQKLNSMDIDEVGVRSAAGASETLWRWDAFDRFEETANAFFLQLTNSLTFVIIPKRAIATPLQIEELRQILEDRISAPTGAFPVIPLSQ